MVLVLQLPEQLVNLCGVGVLARHLEEVVGPGGGTGLRYLQSGPPIGWQNLSRLFIGRLGGGFTCIQISGSLQGESNPLKAVNFYCL